MNDLDDLQRWIEHPWIARRKGSKQFFFLLLFRQRGEREDEENTFDLCKVMNKIASRKPEKNLIMFQPTSSSTTTKGKRNNFQIMYIRKSIDSRSRRQWHCGKRSSSNNHTPAPCCRRPENDTQNFIPNVLVYVNLFVDNECRTAQENINEF